MIERLTSDSRRATPGAAFFAWPGAQADGRRFIPQAIERGCAAVVWEREGFAWDARWKAPNAALKDLKSQAGFLALILLDNSRLQTAALRNDMLQHGGVT